MVIQTILEIKLMVYYLRSHTLPLQYISLLSILASALLQIFGMICMMIYIQQLLSSHSERSLKPIALHKHIHPNFCTLWSLSRSLTTAISQVNEYSFLLFIPQPLWAVGVLFSPMVSGFKRLPCKQLAAYSICWWMGETGNLYIPCK